MDTVIIKEQLVIPANGPIFSAQEAQYLQDHIDKGIKDEPGELRYFSKTFAGETVFGNLLLVSSEGSLPELQAKIAGKNPSLILNLGRPDIFFALLFAKPVVQDKLAAIKRFWLLEEPSNSGLIKIGAMFCAKTETGKWEIAAMFDDGYVEPGDAVFYVTSE